MPPKAGGVASGRPAKGPMSRVVRFACLAVGLFCSGQAFGNSVPYMGRSEGSSPGVGVVVIGLLFVHLLMTVAIEWMSTFWVRRRCWFGAVALVNLLTYPVFFFLFGRMFADEPGVLMAELAVAAVEGGILCLLYGFGNWRRLFFASFVMNAVSYGASRILLLLL